MTIYFEKSDRVVTVFDVVEFDQNNRAISMEKKEVVIEQLILLMAIMLSKIFEIFCSQNIKIIAHNCIFRRPKN